MRDDSEETTEAATTGAEKRTAEDWAAAKGHAPEFLAPRPRPGKNAGAVGRPVHNPKFALFASARALAGWAQGAELTEAEYDAAVDAAADPSKNTFR